MSVGNNIAEAQKMDGNCSGYSNRFSSRYGATAGAAAAGAVAGSFSLPPIGTVVGAGVGVVITVGLNTKTSIFGETVQLMLLKRSKK